MRHEYTETIEIAEGKDGTKIPLSGLIHNRKNIEIKDEFVSNEQSMVILEYTGYPEKERTVNRVCIKGKPDSVVMDATIECPEHSPAIKVDFKGTVRNIRSSIASYTPEYYNFEV